MNETEQRNHLIQKMPTGPGVYQMVDDSGVVVYVGKARNIRSRIRNHFQNADTDAKTRAMVRQIKDIHATLTHTETEALLLESNLIKRHTPRYNVLLRDDKSYPYIFLSRNHDYPRLAFHRGPQKEKGRYFGPYPSAGAVRETLKLMQKIFPVRQCEDTFFANRSRPCLQYQIERCSGPCTGEVDEETYREYVRQAELFLAGRNEELDRELTERMERASAEMRFEEAARLRDQIRAIRRVQEHQHVSGGSGDHDVIAVRMEAGVACVQVFFIRGGRNLGNRGFFPKHTEGVPPEGVLQAFLTQFYDDKPVPPSVVVNQALSEREALEAAFSERMERKVAIACPQRGEKRHWVAMAEHNADNALQRRISDEASLEARYQALADSLGLEAPPERMECFDISHTRGEGTVASCVVFDREGPRKSDYRRFNIRDIEAGDDYAAMEQALSRRYGRLKREGAVLPDLVIVDGGRGQLHVAERVFEELQVSGVELLGVSKGPERRAGEEDLWQPGQSRAFRLDPHSKALHLLQQIRDEAHRFAVSGHRQRRSKARRESALDGIPGVGGKRKKALLSHFGGLKGIRSAGVEDLQKVQGISRGLAERIYAEFHSGNNG
ncbi:excinuclease ABC subunit UvrC [Thiohalorhabdus methylotrophus]|uniref:UvrABC system protein C n=1 Tax=Thiohalorhabdus methylotrophus TaxID=3242694 RepID=A0ABV4TXL2_9GAMM